MSHRDEQGSGLLGTVLATGIFLLLMLLSVQVLTHLYATSVVEAAAYDAVQAVSARDGRGVAEAESHARGLLGRLSDGATFDWAADGDEVVLRLTAERRQALPAPLGERLGADRIEREFRMRVERFR